MAYSDPTQYTHHERAVACHCSSETHCSNGATVCWSITGCFHSLKLDTSLEYAIEEKFGCFANHTNQIDLHCRSPVVRNPLVYCCTPFDGDFCNANLGPHIARSPADVFFTRRNAIPITMAFLLPLFTLIFGLIAIGLLWQCVFRVRLKRCVRQTGPVVDPAPASIKPRWGHSQLCFILCHCVNHKINGSGFSRSNGPYKTVPVVFNMPSQIKPSGQIIPSAEAVSPNRRAKDRNEDLIGCTSGSGSGQPFLVQRTVARHIQLITCIGKGRFGEVWRAICQGEVVAVKIFSSRDESSWARETEVYNTGLLRHPNLLAYYASDMISRGGCTQLWLVTAYHANGSLHDYLSNHTVSLEDGLRLARSITAGLAFLHTEIQGLQAKPPIAHRDIKSKNVLVRDDKEACIADLGLAMVYTKPLLASSVSAAGTEPSAVFSGTGSGTTQSDFPFLGFSGPSSFGPLQPAGPRVGTKRYMAPELLLVVADRHRDCTVSGTGPADLELKFPDYPEVEDEEVLEDLPDGFNSAPYLPFEIYQAADVYAMSLVFWEILRCTKGSLPAAEETEGYQIPYQDMVPVDPTFGQMRRVVCGDLNPLPSLAPTMFNPSADPDNTENTVVPTSLSNSLRDQSAACRPPISRRWVQDPYLSRMTQIMQECWHQHWSARLPALRVRKTIEMLEQTLHRSTSGIAGTTTAIGDVVLDEPEYRQCEIQSMRRFDSSLTDI